MKEKRSTKTYVEYGNKFLKLLKANEENSYFLDVLYYYVRRAVSVCDFNLEDCDGFNMNGRFMGYKQEIIFSPIFKSTLKSLGLVLSIRAIILDKSYLQYCYDNRLLFYNLDDYFISWDSHRIIMECISDEDFMHLYEMVLIYKKTNCITDEMKEDFVSRTVRPEYKHFEDYLRKLACNPDYHGRSVIKDNEYLNSDIEDFVVPDDVDYIGNTAFAYCNNLQAITFTRKVLFGFFPIIECNNLKKIIVPTELINYYRDKLPFFKDIIMDNRQSVTIVPDSLLHIFDKKVTSYKYFWFWAILDLTYKRKKAISYMRILAKMVAKAWEYVYVLDYNLGERDQLRKYMDIIKEKLYLKENTKEEDVEGRVLEFYNVMNLEIVLAPLLKNVPYRFLSPWIPFTNNEEVVEKSNEVDAQCLYALKDDYILINTRWFDYLIDNYEIITKFIKGELESYLKNNN